MKQEDWPDKTLTHVNVANLLRVTAEDLCNLRPADDNATFSAAALARGRRLLEAADALVQQGRADTAGILIRSLFETVISGLFFMYGGDEALAVGKANLWWQVGKLELESLSPPPDAKQQRPNFGTVMTKVVTLLGEQQKQQLGEELQQQYKKLYHLESYTSTHAGYGALDRHIDVSEPLPKIALVGTEPGDALDLLAVGAELLVRLAIEVYVAHDLDPKRLTQV